MVIVFYLYLLVYAALNLSIYFWQSRLECFLFWSFNVLFVQIMICLTFLEVVLSATE